LGPEANPLDGTGKKAGDKGGPGICRKELLAVTSRNITTAERKEEGKERGSVKGKMAPIHELASDYGTALGMKGESVLIIMQKRSGYAHTRSAKRKP